MKLTAALFIMALLCAMISAQTDQTTPLHLLKPNYSVPYGIPKPDDVKQTLERVRNYLDGVTPTGFINDKTGAPVTDLSKIDADTVFARGDFRIVSYEWGVTYAGMLLAAEATGDQRYRDYAEKRMSFIAASAAGFKTPPAGYSDWEAKMPLRNLLFPRAR